MEPSHPNVLTPFNYFDWKAEMVILLRSKGLYRITMGTEVEPNSAVEKSKFFNRMDEAFGLLCLSISRDLLFHVESLATPNEVWLKLETLFGKTDEMRGHQLENELVSLSPGNFDSIQDFFTKFKNLVLQIRQCGIEKKEEQLVLSILSKLGSEYSVFVSSFNSTRLTVRGWKMPSLADFMEMLTQEQDKLVLMGSIKQKDQVLAAGDSKYGRGKQKPKGPKPQEKKMKEKKHSSDESSSSSDEDSKVKKMKSKKEKPKCGYCRGSHNEKSCFRKKIDILTKLLEEHNIDVPDFARREEAKLSLEQDHCLYATCKGKKLYDLGERAKYFSDISVSDLHSDISDSEKSVSSLKESPSSSPKLSPNTSNFSLVFDMPSESSFPLQSDLSYSDMEDNMQADIQVMTAIKPFPQPSDAQKTTQTPSSTVGKSHNFIVSKTVSLIYLGFMSCISFLGWTAMSLAIMGLLFHMSGPDLTTYGSKLKSPDPSSLLNCQCDPVTHTSLTVKPFDHGDIIPLVFAAPYGSYSDISEPHDLYYRFGKVLHQFGRKIHGLICHVEAPQNADFVEIFDVLWEGFCRDIFSIIDHVFISEYVCSKKHSYNAPPSSNDEIQGAFQHVFFLQNIEELVHDHDIHNIFTKYFSKKLFIQLIQVKNKTC